MSSTNIDYVDTYFEFPSLTRIHGQPTYASLKIVKDELKANASSVTSVPSEVVPEMKRASKSYALGTYWALEFLSEIMKS